MNAKGREVLIAAALAGVRQVRHMEYDGEGGYCGLGVLAKAAGTTGLDMLDLYDLEGDMVCPLCPHTHMAEGPEFTMVAHLNDYHELDFLGIANKMPDTEARA